MSHSHDKTTQHNCPACNYGQFTRNNYFTGKLLVERDFTEEQRFHIDKLRHHEQRLHGWGVVCGLKVKQHPIDNCRDRFVCIEPGTAIDCCGHDIIVREEQFLDLAPLIKSLTDKTDTGSHTLQICLRYRECPTEEIPVLYDECGCDDTQCAPNRILESYELDVILDAPKDADAIHSPRIQWENNIALAHSDRVALHEDSSRLYVMTTDGSGSIYQLSTDNHTVLTSHPLSSKGMALAVSNDGTRLYVVTEASPRKLLVLDTANLAAAPTQTMDIADSDGSDIYLAVAPQPDARLFALVAKTGKLRIFGTDINGSGVPAPPKDINLTDTNLSGLAIGSDAAHAYVGDPDPTKHQVKVVDVTTSAVSAITVLPNNSGVSALAVARSTGPDVLAVADGPNKKMHLVGLSPATLLASSGVLDHPPIDLAVTAGGHWVYLLEKDGTKAYVQALSAHRLQSAPAGEVVNPGPKVAVGDLSQQIIVTDSGDHLFIPYTGDLAVATDGGVAILTVDETACSEILWRQLEGCPHCDVANCVVLATIKNYHAGYKVLDQTDPPADPLADDTNKKSRINNRTRRLLPSTQVLAELVECLLEHPAAGGAGKQGPVGPPGPPGSGVTGATAVPVSSGANPTAVLDNAGVITFGIPKGEKGDPGDPGGGLSDVVLTIVTCKDDPHAEIKDGVLTLIIPSGCDTDLTHICAINWTHNGGTAADLSRLNKEGLLIAFDRDVFNSDLDSNSVTLLAGQPNSTGGTCWCEVQGNISGGNFKERCKTTGFQPNDKKEEMVNGVQFKPDSDFQSGTEYRVIVKGDFIRDLKKKAVDADHLPPWFPSKDYKTGDGVAGGTFQSWFGLKSQKRQKKQSPAR